MAFEAHIYLPKYGVSGERFQYRIVQPSLPSWHLYLENVKLKEWDTLLVEHEWRSWLAIRMGPGWTHIYVRPDVRGFVFRANKPLDVEIHAED